MGTNSDSLSCKRIRGSVNFPFEVIDADSKTADSVGDLNASTVPVRPPGHDTRVRQAHELIHGGYAVSRAR